MPHSFLVLITPSLVILLAAAVVAVLTDNWRLKLGMLAVQYGATAVLAAQMVIWRHVLAMMLTGGLVTCILFLPIRQFETSGGGKLPWHSDLPSGLLFRLVAASMVAAVAWYTASRPEFILPGLPPAAAIGSYTLMALGLFGLGLTEEPLNAGMILLMWVNGFHLAYVALEQSLLVAALLAAVNFGIAIVVSYLAGETYGRHLGEDGKPAADSQ